MGEFCRFIGPIPYRILLIIILPILPLILLIGRLIQAAPDYWSDLKDLYRTFPKAFKKGEPL